MPNLMNAQKYEAAMTALIGAARSLKDAPLRGMLKAGVPPKTPDIVIEHDLWRPGKRELEPWLELAAAGINLQKALAVFEKWQAKK